MKLSYIIFLLTVFISEAGNAHAQDSKKLENKFEIRIGGYYGHRDTNFKLSINGGANTTVSIEDDLGIASDMKVFRVEAIYAFTPKHHFKAGFFKVSSQGQRIINEQLNIGDKVFDINTGLNSKFADSILSFTYSYMFIDEPTWELGASIGVHLQKNSVNISSNDGSRIVTDSLSVPLPLIGTKGKWNITPRFHFLASAEIFYMKIGSYKGSLIDFNSGVEYDLTDNVGIGVSGNWLKIKITSKGDNFQWDYNWQTSGAHIYLKIGF